MKTIILAAGMGTRLQPLTLALSKPMLPLANRPMLEWVIKSMPSGDIIVVANRQQKDVIDYFGSSCKIVIQEEQLGTAHALAQCEQHVAGKFILVYADNLASRQDMQRLAAAEPLTASAFRKDSPEQYGVFETSNGFITKIAEKPEHPETNLINAGIYVLDKRIFPAIREIEKSARGEYELTDAMQLLIGKGEKIRCHALEKWIDISMPWQLLDANEFILREHGSQISGSVHASAIVEEPAAIGEGAVIGPHCYIRKYSSVGKNCRIVGSEIKNSIIMDGTKLHRCYVGDSVVGRSCNIAAGTVLANLRLDEKNVSMRINGKSIDTGRRKLGAIVADGVKFGVNAAVMPGRRIWPGMLIPPCCVVRSDVEAQPELIDAAKQRQDAS